MGNCNCNLFYPRSTKEFIRTGWNVSVRSRSNWNLKVLVFKERGKPEYPEKNLSEQGREPTTNSTHIWRRRQDSNPGHIGGRRVLSPLRHPCSPDHGWIQSVATYAFPHRICLLEFFNALKFKNTKQFQRANATAKRVCCKWIVNPPKIGFHWNGKRGMEKADGNRERALGTRGRAKLKMEKTDLTLCSLVTSLPIIFCFPFLVPRISNFPPRPAFPPQTI